MASDRMSRQEWERIKVEDFERLEADLAQAQARADALAVEHAELRAALYLSVSASGPPVCRGCFIPRGGWTDPQPGEHEHTSICWVAPLLAADPARRGADLIAAADRLGKAVQCWLDDPDVDATQAETDLLGNAYGEWINCRLRSGPGQDGEA